MIDAGRPHPRVSDCPHQDCCYAVGYEAGWKDGFAQTTEMAEFNSGMLTWLLEALGYDFVIRGIDPETGIESEKTSVVDAWKGAYSQLHKAMEVVLDDDEPAVQAIAAMKTNAGERGRRD